MRLSSGQKGDKVIVVAYGSIDVKEAIQHEPTVVFVDDKNKPREIRKEKRATKNVY